MIPLDSILQRLFPDRTAVTAIWLAIPVLVGVWVVRVSCAANWSGGLLWGLAALSVGALVGFLFGIPRILQSDQPAAPVSVSAGASVRSGGAYRVQVNTNLEQISDWLTKIIVGLGLINLSKIGSSFVHISEYVGSSFGADAANAHFACALLIYFSAMGLLLGYLLTRLYLTGAFVAADRAAASPEEFRSELEREARAGDSNSKDLPSEAQVAAAERMGVIALGVDEPVVRRQVEDLSREYERARSSMRAGPERTRHLDEIVLRMRTLGMAGRFLLPELTASSSPGMRLAAIAMLEVTPDRQYLTWLADRFDDNVERPFVVHHAAVALCTAAAQLDPRDVQPALALARDRAASLKPDGSREQILIKAGQTLERRLPAPPPQARSTSA
jgi:hypothetical protein